MDSFAALRLCGSAFRILQTFYKLFKHNLVPDTIKSWFLDDFAQIFNAILLGCLKPADGPLRIV
jgi:hypothetical protein